MTTEICEVEPEEADYVRAVLDQVGGRWSLLMFRALRDGPLRFTELQRATPGISQRMLTHTLRGLQRDGLVSRESFAEAPPRVVYTLTPLGHTFVPVVKELVGWALRHQSELAANQDAWDEAIDSALLDTA